MTAIAPNASVQLAWSPVSGATSYNVKRATASGGPYTSVFPAYTLTGYTDTGLTNGTNYYYVVSANNAYGEGANSVEAGDTPRLPLTGTIIGTSGSFGGNPATTKEAAMDGDPGTAYDADSSSGAWVGLNLGTVKVIKLVRS
jgi:hypothetical protein